MVCGGKIRKIERSTNAPVIEIFSLIGKDHNHMSVASSHQPESEPIFFRESVKLKVEQIWILLCHNCCLCFSILVCIAFLGDLVVDPRMNAIRSHFLPPFVSAMKLSLDRLVGAGV